MSDLKRRKEIEMKKVTIARVNGCEKLSRKTLERNAMDILTMREDADFEECLEWVEEASREELISLLVKAWGEDA